MGKFIPTLCLYAYIPYTLKAAKWHRCESSGLEEPMKSSIAYSPPAILRPGCARYLQSAISVLSCLLPEDPGCIGILGFVVKSQRFNAVSFLVTMYVSGVWAQAERINLPLTLAQMQAAIPHP